jgi:hypothetical protein
LEKSLCILWKLIDEVINRFWIFSFHCLSLLSSKLTNKSPSLIRVLVYCKRL